MSLAQKIARIIGQGNNRTLVSQLEGAMCATLMGECTLNIQIRPIMDILTDYLETQVDIVISQNVDAEGFPQDE